MKSGVYVIVNKINNKKYVGSTINFEKRWKQHISALNSNHHDNSYLQKSWNKYGAANFEFMIIEVVEPKFLIEREQYYINLYNVCDKNIGYNLLPTAGNILGYKHSDETKLKMSNIKKGKILSDKTKINISLGHKGIKYNVCRKGRKGNKHSDETKKKMSENRKGRHLTEATKMKISISHKGKNLSHSTKEKISIALKGNKNGAGRTVSDETRKNISITHIGINTGKKNGRAMAVTNEEEVLKIRNDYNSGMTIPELQSKYSRTYTIIYNIIKNITWKWLDNSSLSY